MHSLADLQKLVFNLIHQSRDVPEYNEFNCACYLVLLVISFGRKKFCQTVLLRDYKNTLANPNLVLI